MSNIEDFNQQLEDLVIEQAKRIINNNIYGKTLLSALPVALLATDLDCCIRIANNATEEILEISEEEMIGKHLKGYFEKQSKLIGKIEKTLEDGRTHNLGSETIRLVSGKEIVGNFYVKPLKDEEKKIYGALLTIEDMTDFHFLQDAFKRYVPPSVSEIIADDPKSLQLGGEEQKLSVLFSDLIGFSRLSEQYSPHDMVTLLSDYFGEMTDQVFAFNGTLKEYVGDELMAIFGAPLMQSDHAGSACSAALSMSKRLRVLRREWSKNGKPALRARIGVNSGPMLVGNLGSRHRFSYGVLGDNVNLASRLEGLNNLYGTEILIGENCAESVGERFILRWVDQVRVKGREKPVRIYELIGHSDESIPDKKISSIEYYEKGFEAYRRQSWKKAINRFEEVLKLQPEDGPARVMIDRCSIYLDSSPSDSCLGEDWDGVFEHKTKK